MLARNDEGQTAVVTFEQLRPRRDMPVQLACPSISRSEGFLAVIRHLHAATAGMPLSRVMPPAGQSRTAAQMSAPLPGSIEFQDEDEEKLPDWLADEAVVV